MDASAFYLLLGLGTAHYESIPNETDGARFCEYGFPCQDKNNGESFSLGLGWRANKTWAFEGSLVHTGTFRLNSQFPEGNGLTTFRGDWHANGLTLAATASYPLGDWSPYAKFGIGVYRFSGHDYVAPLGEGFVDFSKEGGATGYRFGPLYGIGIAYNNWQIKPYAEITQQHTSGQGYPGFSTWTTALIGIRIDLK